MWMAWVPVAPVGSPLNDWKSQCGLMTKKDTRAFEQNLQSSPWDSILQHQSSLTHVCQNNQPGEGYSSPPRSCFFVPGCSIAYC